MSDQPPACVHHIGLAVFANLDLGDDVPDELEIDLRNVYAGIAPRACKRQVTYVRSVKTLDDLVGADPLTGPQQAATRPLPGVQAVVIGDSTAAAIGNSRLPNATPLDRACGRSIESYAADLAMVNNWTVLNLACSGATVQNGLLGAQVRGNGQVAPPQLAEAARATHAKVIVVSVGADDVQWSIMTKLCVASTVCNDKVSGAFFGKLIGDFTRSYYELLGDLAALPGSPAVLINQYYSPFGPDLSCLAKYGITAAKAKVLEARLNQLNTVLAQGAQTFGFGVTSPQFTGHELCTADPYVQGPNDRAPLHPTAEGELAIALADQQALPKVEGLVPAPSPTPTLSAGQERPRRGRRRGSAPPDRASGRRRTGPRPSRPARAAGPRARRPGRSGRTGPRSRPARSPPSGCPPCRGARSRSPPGP